MKKRLYDIWIINSMDNVKYRVAWKKFQEEGVKIITKDMTYEEAVKIWNTLSKELNRSNNIIYKINGSKNVIIKKGDILLLNRSTV